MNKTLMTFGDSNTHGTPPMTALGPNPRFGPGTRWPTVTAATLGPNWTLVEEGLPGRTATTQADPLMGAHMNGQMGLRIALASHGPIDLLTIMLGTNDTKTHFAQTAEAITGHIAALLGIARDPLVQEKHGGFDILLICPPKVRETGMFQDSLMGAAAKSAALPGLYKSLATHWRIGFLDAGQHITTCDEDGVHFDATAHHTLGQAVAAEILAS